MRPGQVSLTLVLGCLIVIGGLILWGVAVIGLVFWMAAMALGTPRHG